MTNLFNRIGDLYDRFWLYVISTNFILAFSLIPAVFVLIGLVDWLFISRSQTLFVVSLCLFLGTLLVALSQYSSKQKIILLLKVATDRTIINEDMQIPFLINPKKSPIIMDRETYEQIGDKFDLPVAVIEPDPNFITDRNLRFNDIFEAFDFFKNAKRIYVIGEGAFCRQVMPYANEAYVMMATKEIRVSSPLFKIPPFAARDGWEIVFDSDRNRFYKYPYSLRGIVFKRRR